MRVDRGSAGGPFRVLTAMPCIAAALLALAAAPRATLQAQAGTSSRGVAPGWSVERDAFIELWYHGLAVAGGPSYGPLPLYSSTYAAAAGDDARGARETPLRRALPALRAARATDSAVEALHFVPLHFVGERPDEALAALEGALAAGAAPAGRDRLTSRARAVAAVFDSRAQRATALAFVRALADEWRSADAPARARRGIDATTLAAIDRRWRGTFAPSLAPYLERIGRTRGVVIPVPSVGPEGRIAVAPDGRTVVVVAAGAGGDADAPLRAAVRELAFPLLGTTSATAHRPRLEMQHARELVAVHAGALLLDAILPDVGDAYRRQFTTAAGRRGRAFEQAFPISPEAERALRAAVDRLVARPGPP